MASYKTPTPVGTGFLKFNRMPPKLVLTADDDDFDDQILLHLREEGFDATYLPLGEGGKAYKDELRHLADDLELGEDYGIICTSRHPSPYTFLAGPRA